MLSLGFKCVLFRRKSAFQHPQHKSRAGVSGRRSGACALVNEPLAGLLPAAGRAPHVTVLHAVHLPALLALSPGLPVRQARKQYSV